MKARSASRMHGSVTGRTEAPLRPRVTPFVALYNRDFRYLWGAFICSSFVQRMDGVILGWLVLEMTDSAFLVGLIAALRFLGALLGPVTGVVADRVDRRRLNITALIVMSTVVASLTMLVAIRCLEVWHLFAATTIGGIIWAFFQPAQQSLQADVLSGAELANGLSLSNMATNITSITGPILGGLLLACCRATPRVWDWSDTEMVLGLNWFTYDAQRLYITTSQGGILTSRDLGMNWEPAPFALPKVIASDLALEGVATGVQWAYLVLLGLHLLQLAGYMAVRPQPRERKLSEVSLWHNLREGMHYVRQNVGLWSALGLAALVNLVSFPLQFSLLPVFARDVFSVGATGLGMLGAALGTGALLGSWLMITMGTTQRAGRLMLTGTFLWQCFSLAFALTPNYEVALGVLLLLGASQSICLISISIMLLGTGRGEMRGRIMGLRSLAVAPLFFGSMLSGAAAEHIGAPLTTVVSAITGILIVACIAPWVPKRVAS